jgi:hypothetical protein
MKPLYYYGDYIHDDRTIIEEYIAFMHEGIGEESLIRIQENEVFILEDLYEVYNWTVEYGFSMKDIRDEFGINLFDVYGGK